MNGVLITVDKGIFRERGGVYVRFLYGYLRYWLGDNVGVVSYYEIARRTGLSQGRVERGIGYLVENHYLSKDYIYFRLEDGTLARKLRLKTLCFNPFPVPSSLLFYPDLTPDEKGLLMTLYFLSACDLKVFYFKSQIIKEFLKRGPSAPLPNRLFKSLRQKGYLLHKKFYYQLIIPDDHKEEGRMIRDNR